ncbi:alpha/beta fold hydrolase [Agromyces sp. NPDC057865]|uniref:alpha/beta fold hydrolase n=1 Tax=Agromyces sp. NPDC057865 TaxID=3346267 RepID=UPI00366E3BBE
MEHRVIEVGGGIRIAVHLSGEPGGPWMVLLHALGERAADWGAVAEHFASTYRVAAVDLRGHGRSEWPGEYAFERMRDDVLGVLDGLGARDVVLVGHSLGGVVAYLVAEAQPERIARLVVEDACPPYPRNGRPMAARPEGPLDFDWEVVPQVHAELDDPDRTSWPALADITAPTLIVAGGPTSHVPQELLVVASEHIPNATLVTIPVGHNVHATASDAFIEVVEGWLRGAG